MDKKTKLIIGGIAVAFMAYMIFRKPKKTTPVPTPSPSLDPLPVDTLPPVTQEEFNTMPVAYGETKEAACLNKSISTVTLHMKSGGLSPNNTKFYTDSSYDTPVKSGYYADNFDTLFVVGEGGLLTEISTCL
jgi:hypothetical protein